MEKATAVNTCLGVLYGRDCIFLDQMKRDDRDNLTLAYFACELDTYENLAGTGHLGGSSFDLIEDSSWLKSLPVREDFDKNSYRLFTYDDVYNIIAVSYSLEAEL